MTDARVAAAMATGVSATRDSAPAVPAVLAGLPGADLAFATASPHPDKATAQPAITAPDAKEDSNVARGKRRTTIKSWHGVPIGGSLFSVASCRTVTRPRIPRDLRSLLAHPSRRRPPADGGG